MTLINNVFLQKEIFSENSSQTVQMNVIKLYIDHLKMKRYLKNKKNLKLIFFQIEKINVSIAQIQEL
jgi:hypothetical protein